MFVYLLRRDSLIANYMYISTCIYLKLFLSPNEKFDIGCSITIPIDIWSGSWITSHQRNHGMAGSCCKPVEIPNVSLSESSTTCVLIDFFFLIIWKLDFIPLKQNLVVTGKCHTKCYFLFSLYFLILVWNGYEFLNYYEIWVYVWAMRYMITENQVHTGTK